MRGPTKYSFVYHVMAAIQSMQQPTINILLPINRAQTHIHEYTKQWVLSRSANKIGSTHVSVRMDIHSGKYA